MVKRPAQMIPGFVAPAGMAVQSRPIGRRNICITVAATWFIATRPSITFADDLPPLDAVKQKMPQFETWLRDSGLSEAIEVVRPRRAPHPTQDTIPIIHLETRWTRPTKSRDQAVAEFATFASTFLRASGHSVQHKLLFKFAQICGIPLQLAAAHINVVDMDVAAYIASDGKPQTDVSGLRLARVTATIPAEPPSATLSGGTAPDGFRVMIVLEQHFSTRSGRFARGPVYPGIVPFRVDNLRGAVVSDSRLWEKLEGTLVMIPDGDKILLYLQMGGQYAAAGFGNAPPSADAFLDLEPRYAKQLADYTSELLQELQERLGALGK